MRKQGGSEVENEAKCPECGNPRKDPSVTCPACGAPPIRKGVPRTGLQEVRTDDLEPYVTLRYIARLFRVLAVLMVLMMIAEVVTGLVKEGGVALPTLIAEATQLIVLAAVMWAAGDITILIIDLGHDIRVSRILLGRINAEMHKANSEREKSG
jgi:hypothetical protein